MCSRTFRDRGIRISSWYEHESTLEAFSYLRFVYASVCTVQTHTCEFLYTSFCERIIAIRVTPFDVSLVEPWFNQSRKVLYASSIYKCCRDIQGCCHFKVVV